MRNLLHELTPLQRGQIESDVHLASTFVWILDRHGGVIPHRYASDMDSPGWPTVEAFLADLRRWAAIDRCNASFGRTG